MGDHPYKVCFENDSTFPALFKYATTGETPSLGDEFSCNAVSPSTSPIDSVLVYVRSPIYVILYCSSLLCFLDDFRRAGYETFQWRLVMHNNISLSRTRLSLKKKFSAMLSLARSFTCCSKRKCCCNRRHLWLQQAALFCCNKAALLVATKRHFWLQQSGTFG
jgi:hypothetical protein